MTATRVSQLTGYQSPWLKAEDLQGRAAVVTIEKATVEELRQPDGKKEGKIVVAFMGKHKKLILNKTQAFDLIRLAGTEVFGDWVGLVVTLTPTVATNRKPTISIGPGPARASATATSTTTSADDNPFVEP